MDLGAGRGTGRKPLRKWGNIGLKHEYAADRDLVSGWYLDEHDDLEGGDVLFHDGRERRW